MNDESKNTVPNIWLSQEKIIHFYRLLACGMAILAIFLLGLTVAFSFRDPIVITKNGDAREFYPSSRGKISIEKTDVESFSKRFLEAAYVWNEFNERQLAKEIMPFAEGALVSKVVDSQSAKYGKELRSKKLAQAITFVRIQVLDDRVVCNFDRVLKIAGIPLVIPTEVTLSMLQDSPTRLNPMGIYVAGILEREGAK